MKYTANQRVKKAIMSDILVSESVTDEYIKAAYEKLPEKEATKIDDLAEQLEIRYKMRWNSNHHQAKANFGHCQALEILAKVGIYLNSHDKKGATNEG